MIEFPFVTTVFLKNSTVLVFLKFLSHKGRTFVGGFLGSKKGI